MTPLLSFEKVCRSHADGDHSQVVFDRVSFDLEAGMFSGVYGPRRSGKSTLLRLACGIELADKGSVRFAGRDVRRMSIVERERLLRADIGLVFADDWRPRPRETVVEYLAFALGSAGARPSEARRRARRVLARLEMTMSADDPASTLSLGERMRVMVGRAIVREPRLLLVDEPAAIPNLEERDELRFLLRAVAGELGATLVVASEEMAPLNGADFVMSIGGGELSTSVSAREPGTVVQFPGGRGSGGHAGGERERLR